jgi:S-DNA-T family DNA segregation ATPase FtsK/SpoIIIE
MFSVTLPEKVKGQYWLCDAAEDGRSRGLLGIEAVGSEWHIKSNAAAALLDESRQATPYAVLSPLGFYNLKLTGTDEKASVFAEPIASDRQKLEKYIVTRPCELTVGREPAHEISFNYQYVSERDGRGHAKLSYDGRTWTITDNGSTNGTYVNGSRVAQKRLEPGDLIFIMGLRIVVGNGFFAINNPGSQVALTSSAITKFEPPEPVYDAEDTPPPEPRYYYRSPRFTRAVETAEITIDPPPAPQRAEQIPIALMLGPAMTMGLTSLSTAALTIMNTINNGGEITQALPTLIMSFSMLLGAVLWPVLTKRHERKVRAANEKKRQTKYFAYLDSVRDGIKRLAKEQSDILNENLISAEACFDVVINAKRTLWERVLGQSDFLTLRLGRGNIPLFADIKYPESRFSLEDDNLQSAVLSLGEEPKELSDVPVGFSLSEQRFTGIIGDRAEALSFVRALLLQLTALHSYDELKLVFLIDRDEMPQWEFVKRLPHVFTDDKSFRWLATTPEESRELSAVLEKTVLANRPDDGRNESCSPHYLVIAADRSLGLKCESLGRMLAYETNRGFSVISVCDELRSLPKEIGSVIEVAANSARIFDKSNLSGKPLVFIPEKASTPLLSRMSEELSGITLDILDASYTLPNMITFLEMFKVGKIEHLNPLTRWKNNNPSLSLQTPIGVDTFGEPFTLDLHEKIHGPHGLVAGTTGSGKSEFILTFVLSLAVNYHPDEVAFLLIDYKGGGLAGAFENADSGLRLPHLAGSITNLDGASIARSMTSIDSEAKRRQTVMNDAKRISGDGTMDIYKYQRLYREKVVPEPMPHLFIIADEFAEMKTQQPEFMDKLISTARIGRSLGIHLILATQKPAGVVDDQIWSNSKFRVCLKVQEKADSVDMLKRPDAAELSQTGRFYLQVGFNELFALGQSAWSGADYVPSDSLESKKDSSVTVIDNLGHTVTEAKPDAGPADTSAKKAQLVSVVRYLSDLAREEHIAVRPLWKPPVPAVIYLGDLKQKYAYKSSAYKLKPLVGEYDDPYNQRQAAMTLDLAADGNCVLYGAAGSGKSEFLTTLIYSLIGTHGADEVNIYALDLGAETLTAFENAPQVGGICLGHEEERIGNLFKLLRAEFDERKKLFAPYGGDYASYIARSGAAKPSVVVIVNNYAGFAEGFEGYEDAFALLSRDGSKYGLHFIITAATTMSVRYRIQQNFRRVITMQQNDSSSYSVIMGKTGGLVPASVTGRGLVAYDRVYEFQAARTSPDGETFDVISAYCAGLRNSAESFAKPVPMLPETVVLDDVRRDLGSLSAVPAGISKRSLNTAKVNIRARYLYPVLASEINPLRAVGGGLAQALAASGAEVAVIDSEYLFPAEADDLPYALDTETPEERVRELFDLIVERHNAYADANKSPAALAPFGERVVVICGLKKLADRLSEDGRDKLKLLLDKGEAIFKTHFVILETPQSFKSFSTEPWYRKHFTGADGLWVGDGFTNQSALSASRTTTDMYEDVGDSFGYVLTKGKTLLVKLLTAGDPGIEGENDE